MLFSCIWVGPTARYARLDERRAVTTGTLYIDSPNGSVCVQYDTTTTATRAC